MNKIMIFISLFSAFTSHGQEPFVLTENGLTPKFTLYRYNVPSGKDLYQQVLTWVEENRKTHRLTIDSLTEGEAVHLSSIKGNAATLNDKYYHAEYSIRISLYNDQWKFEPTAIHLKLNSKYDMGWKPFELSDGSLYFKKGKVIKKYRAYIHDMIAPLNQLYSELNAYFLQE